MRQARAVPLPNETLHIEEIKFWLKIMQEHTVFIKAGLPADAKDYIDASQEFCRAFTSLGQKAERLKSVKQSSAFTDEALSVMAEFQRYQRKLLAEKLCCKLGGSLFPFFLDHITREGDCFLELLGRVKETEAPKGISHTRQIVVWLRFMADHTRLICHYVDPSERRIAKMAAQFAELFDSLVLEGRDLASMLYCHKGEVRAFRRFLQDARLDVQRLRDFNKMAEDLIGGCRLLGIISAELAAHMRREAEHCLLMIALMEKEIVKHCPDDYRDDLAEEAWPQCERTEDEGGKDRPEEPEAPCAQPEAWEAPETVQAAGDEREETPQPLSREEPQESWAEPVMVDFTSEPAPEEEYPRSEAEVVALVEAEKAEQQAPVKAQIEAREKPLEEPETTAAEPEITAPAPVETQAAPEPPPQKERVYAKASDYKYMPSKYAGRTPGERADKKKKELKLPRSLGKLRI